MLHPSYTEIIDTANNEVELGEQPVTWSRYSIVIVTTERARQLVTGEIAEVPDFKKKPLSVTIEELHRGKVKIVSGGKTEEAAEEQEQDEE